MLLGYPKDLGTAWLGPDSDKLTFLAGIVAMPHHDLSRSFRAMCECRFIKDFICVR